MKIAPVVLENGSSIVYVVPDDQDAADCLIRVHETLAEIQGGGVPKFSAVSQPVDVSLDATKGDEIKRQMHTSSMNDIKREEIDLKLQLIEERLDRKVSDISRAVQDINTSNASTLSAFKHAKWWAIGTAVAVLAIFLGTLQWGLQSQKEENARFNSYVREDIKSISEDVKEISKAVTEMRIKMESQNADQK